MSTKNEIITKLTFLKDVYRKSIILNPTENMPLYWNNMCSFGFSHGLYIADEQRDDIERLDPKIIFGGRNDFIDEVTNIHKSWAQMIGAERLSFRLLSGLHAYVIVFMSIGNIGDTILILPEEGGGHFSVNSILTRLGYKVHEMVIDYQNRCIDITETNKLIKHIKPRFIVVDRSEGLNYEDFSRLDKKYSQISFFDASQYLTNIIAGDFTSPFQMGFQAIMATIHKNFPGPQKAFIAFQKGGSTWKELEKKMFLYVSNTHALNTYLAGMAIDDIHLLKKYSDRMLSTAIALREGLEQHGISVIQPSSNDPSCHHIWIQFETKKAAFLAFKKLEMNRIFVNYRLLPYQLGYGLRLGTPWASMMGLKASHCNRLAELIAWILDEEELKSSYCDEVLKFRNQMTPLYAS